MEKIGIRVDTAEDLYQLLRTIPEGIRERLPVMIENQDYCNIEVDAYETTETQGNIERGFLIRRDVDE
jgi:hypothetical protein